MSTSSMAAKTTLRRLMRGRLMKNLPLREERSQNICETLLAHPAWRRAKVIGLFSPLPEEPNLLRLLEVPGKRYAFPCVREQGLEWRLAATAADLLPALSIAGRILHEPTHGAVLGIESIDCLFVPGLAFTGNGHRLGRGGGYYDRTLAQRSRGTSALGVCFAFQLMDALPTESHDSPVDGVVHDALPQPDDSV